jgi:hypothetical protein
VLQSLHLLCWKLFHGLNQHNSQFGVVNRLESFTTARRGFWTALKRDTVSDVQDATTIEEACRIDNLTVATDATHNI